MTIHRFVEADRVSLIWELASHACVSSYHAEHKGSLRFEPSPEDPSHAAVCVASVDFAPQPMGDGASDSMGAAVDSAIAMYDNAVGLQCQALQRLLLEQAQ